MFLNTFHLHVHVNINLTHFTVKQPISLFGPYFILFQASLFFSNHLETFFSG